MADVDMPDAGPSGTTKAKDHTAKNVKGGGVEAAMDSKKRFEVKKVYLPLERSAI